jgi:fumarate hydratase class I
MGLGGKTTLLGVKIAGICRHPACYFVTVSYSCWATRRYTAVLDETGGITEWI